jgi:anti-sigma B factor antagonist
VTDIIEITENMRDGWHIVHVKGRVDGLTAESLEKALIAAATAHPQVAVDCSAVDYISSAGLRSLLEGARAAQGVKHTFVVCSPSARVKQVFDISRMHQVLPIQAVLPC